MAFEKVSNDDNEVLIARFGEEEIKEAIWECGSSKSQGPNGYISMSLIVLLEVPMHHSYISFPR